MDIHKYKRRLTASELKISESNISQANKKIIFDFERQLFLKELSPGRIENYLFVLGRIAEKTNKNLDSLDKADIELVLEGMHRADLSAYTIKNYKTCLKGFLKLNGKTELADSIHVKTVKPKIPDIFSREEVLTMIDVAWHPMDKALIAALNETGCRIGEMASLNIRNVHFDKYGAVLIVEEGKTGPRGSVT